MGGAADCACQDTVPAYLKAFVRENEDFITTIEEDYDLYVTVDTASPSQMGGLVHLCEKVYASIDHHENCTNFSDYFRINDASAAGEAVYEIYKILLSEGKLCESCEAARLIFMAISSDSGSFQYSNTTSKTMHIAAELMETINSEKCGMDTAEISRLLYNNKTLKELNAKKIFIDKLSFAENGQIGYIVLTRDDIESFDLGSGELSTAIDIPRCVEGVRCAFVLKEEKNSEKGERAFRLSTRSNSEINVAAVCKAFGGGGHVKAAGATVTAKNEKEALEKVLSQFKIAIFGE